MAYMKRVKPVKFRDLDRNEYFTFVHPYAGDAWEVMGRQRKISDRRYAYQFGRKVYQGEVKSIYVAVYPLERGNT